MLSGTAGSSRSDPPAPPERRRGAGGQLLRLGITIALLALLAFVVAEPREVVQAIARMSLPALGVALVLAAGDRVLMAYKWQRLLRARGVPLPLGVAVRAYFASTFAGLFLPVTLGADALRVVAIRQFGVYDVTASVVVERTLGAVAMFSVALVSCTLLAYALTEAAFRSVAVVLVVVALVGAAAFPASLWAAGRLAVKRTGDNSKLGRIASAYAAYGRHPRELVVFYVLSVIETLVPTVTTWVVARGLGFDLPLWVFAATLPIALSIARLPISLGGFGVQEASFVYLAGLLGVGASDALATMLVSGAVLLLTLLPAAYDVTVLGSWRDAR